MAEKQEKAQEKAEKTEKRGPGRPEKKLDEAMIYNLASIHCTFEEIAAMVGCNRKTLQRKYSELIAEGKAKGKASLRRLQWKSAEKGSHSMLIWLGKQLLGQRDKFEDEILDQEKLADKIVNDIQKMQKADRGEE